MRSAIAAAWDDICADLKANPNDHAIRVIVVLTDGIDNASAIDDAGLIQRIGYAKADGVIQQTGDLISKAVEVYGTPDDFVGHIGGDDFVVISTPAKADAVAATIVKEFDRRIVALFSREDLERGYLEVINRKGTVDRFPLLTMTVAMVSAGKGRVDHIAQISDIASELKRYGKSLEGSVVVKERRKNGQVVPVGLTQG
jgi:GGDEF domain-containing protein